MDEKSGSNYIIICRGILRRLFDAPGVASGANSSGRIRNANIVGDNLRGHSLFRTWLDTRYIKIGNEGRRNFRDDNTCVVIDSGESPGYFIIDPDDFNEQWRSMSTHNRLADGPIVIRCAGWLE